MSRYSGKYDFYDHLWISAETEEEVFNKFNGTKLYICQPLPRNLNFELALDCEINIPETYYKRVEYSSIKDLIPLYSHLTSISCCDNTDSRNSVICLSSKPFTDLEEQDLLEYYLKWILRIYNRCKRKKIEFNVEDAIKEVCWSNHNKEQITELANRVKEKGKKASIENIHISMQEYYRKELVNEMLAHGLNPADYGYERFVGN